MQPKVFHRAPQSILSTQPSGSVRQADGRPAFKVDGGGSSRPGLKRTRKPLSKVTDQVAPTLSASASSWGAADESEGDAVASSDSDADTLTEQQQQQHSNGTAPTAAVRAIKRRRRHLEADDVGRFASLSIDRATQNPKRASPSPAPYPPSILLRPATPSPPPEVRPTSIEEPDEDDIEMRARRGTTTHQLDRNRFYVTSLSDESEDEEAREMKREDERVDSILSSSPVNLEQDGNFLVNGELINRLQALESQRRFALGRDRALLRRRSRDRHSDDSGSTTPTALGKTKQGALILWKSPQLLSQELKEQAQSPRSNAQDSSPPVVIEDGDFACVHRPASPFAFQDKSPSPVSVTPTPDEMDVDD